MPSEPDVSPSRKLGATDVLVSPLCLGGNVFGWTADADDSFEVLDAYAAAGGNFIDTADVYSEFLPGNSGGESESIIGKWMTARRNRADMIIATKVGKKSSHKGLSRSTIHSAVDASLARLGTDYIDLYYAHADDPEVPMEETLAAFADVVQQGKVRFIAASNFSAERLREALEHSRRHRLPGYVAVQDHYNLMEREHYEGSLEQVVIEYGLASLPYFGLARGFLTGKYRAGAKVESPRAGAVEQYVGPRGDRVITALTSIASAHKTTIASVALGWLLQQPGVVAPLASARSRTQRADLLPVGRLTLSEAEVRALTAASDPG